MLVWLLLLLALLPLLSACADPVVPNPAALWINYSQREVDLVLVDHEPPPF